MRETAAPLCLLALLTAVNPTRAQTVFQGSLAQPVTVFSSFGFGNADIATIGWGVIGADAPAGATFQGHAESFVPGLTGYLYSLQLGMYQLTGPGTVNLFLAQDSGGVPGAMLESFLNVPLPARAGSVVGVSSAEQPLLLAGATYWICAEPTADATIDVWNENSQGLVTPTALESAPWSWQPFVSTSPDAAFSVSVTPVPEPAGIAVAAIGLFLLARAATNNSKETTDRHR